MQAIQNILNFYKYLKTDSRQSKYAYMYCKENNIV